MHIILVSDRLATAKTVVLTWRHLAGITALLGALVIALASLFSYVSVRHAAEIRLPLLKELLRSTAAEEQRASQEFVRENLNAMATRLGEMQAQLLRLDSMGERLYHLMGVKPQEVPANDPEKNGRGGPLVLPDPMTTDDLQQALDVLSEQIEAKSDALSLLETQLFDERIRKSLLPTSLPLESGWNASGFGLRVDPFTGQMARHEGVDFPADIGTPIRSAAAGVVIGVSQHPEYGNLVEIDHGNDLTTRYAHCSKVFVQQGALVKRGQVIAAVGNTGRSTGPHLHFEVRIGGVAHNPNRFLQMAKANGLRLTRSK